MKPLLWIIGAIAGPWLAIGGLIVLALGVGVLEVLCLELAALTVMLAAVGAVLIDQAASRTPPLGGSGVTRPADMPLVGPPGPASVSPPNPAEYRVVERIATQRAMTIPDVLRAGIDHLTIKDVDCG